MKKIAFTKAPVATPQSAGLMAPVNTLAQFDDAVTQVKLISGDAGYLLSTIIPAGAPAHNILLRITENNYTAGVPGFQIIQAYSTMPAGNNRATMGMCGQVEIVNIDGKICFYITPVNANGYSALIEIYAISVSRVIANPGIKATVRSRPSGAITITNFE